MWADLGAATVTSGGTDAPSAGTSEAWTVDTTVAFPACDESGTPATFFYIRFADGSTEIALVTDAPGGTGSAQSWTVTRGACGTTPVTHTTGFAVVQVAGAETLRGLQSTPLNIVLPSGDDTGVSDTASLNAALTSPGALVLSQGTYYMGTGSLTPPAGTAAAMYGAGSPFTTIISDGTVPMVNFNGNTGSQRFGMSGISLTQNGAGDVMSCTGGSQNRFPQLYFTDVAMTLGTANSSGAWLNGDGPDDSNILASSVFRNCTFNSSGTTRTVPGINLVCQVSGGMSDITWDKCYFNPSDNEQYTVYLSATTGADNSGYLQGIALRDCRWEHPYGGAIQVMSGRNVVIENPAMWDLSTEIANSLIYIGTNSDQYPSEGVQIINYWRYQGSGGGCNAGGPWDIEVDANSAQVKIDSPSALEGGFHTDPAPVYLNFNGCPTATVISIQPSSGAADAALTNITNPPVALNGTDYAPVMSEWTPQDFGYVAYPFDPVLLTGATARTPTGGDIELIGVRVRNWTTISGRVDLYVTQAGTALTASENYFGLYNSGGTLVAASSDMSATWNSVGAKEGGTLTLQAGQSFTLQPGQYWIALLANAGTATPSFAYGPAQFNVSSFYGNARLSASSARWGTYAGSYTSLPASIAPGSIALSQLATYWAGLY